jgi:hypothetical protein
VISEQTTGGISGLWRVGFSEGGEGRDTGRYGHEIQGMGRVGIPGGMRVISDFVTGWYKNWFSMMKTGGFQGNSRVPVEGSSGGVFRTEIEGFWKENFRARNEMVSGLKTLHLTA